MKIWHHLEPSPSFSLWSNPPFQSSVRSIQRIFSIRTTKTMSTMGAESSRWKSIKCINLHLRELKILCFLPESKASRKKVWRTWSGWRDHQSSSRWTSKSVPELKCARGSTGKWKIADSIERIRIPTIAYSTSKVPNLSVQLSLHLWLIRKLPSRSAIPSFGSKLLPSTRTSTATNRTANVHSRR